MDSRLPVRQVDSDSRINDYIKKNEQGVLLKHYFIAYFHSTVQFKAEGEYKMCPLQTAFTSSGCFTLFYLFFSVSVSTNTI